MWDARHELRFRDTGYEMLENDRLPSWQVRMFEGSFCLVGADLVSACENEQTFTLENLLTFQPYSRISYHNFLTRDWEHVTCLMLEGVVV